METYPLLDNAILLFQLVYFDVVQKCYEIKMIVIILKFKLTFLFVLVCTFWS